MVAEAWVRVSVWAAACGHHGGSEGLGGMDRWHGLKGLDGYDPPNRRLWPGPGLRQQGGKSPEMELLGLASGLEGKGGCWNKEGEQGDLII